MFSLKKPKDGKSIEITMHALAIITRYEHTTFKTSNAKTDYKVFKTLNDYFEWIDNIKLYLHTRLNESVYKLEATVTTWIDQKGGSIWSIKTQYSETRASKKCYEKLLGHKKLDYLKDKVWDDKRGWVSKQEAESYSKEFIFG